MKNKFLFLQKRLVYMAGESTEGPKSAEKPLSAIEDPYEAMNARQKIYENATKEADRIISDPNASDKAKTAAQALKNRVQNARQNDKLPDRMFDTTAESIDRGRQGLLNLANAAQPNAVPAPVASRSPNRPSAKPGEVVLPQDTITPSSPTKPANAPNQAAAKPHMSDAQRKALSAELDNMDKAAKPVLGPQRTATEAAGTKPAPDLPPPPIDTGKK